MKINKIIVQCIFTSLLFVFVSEVKAQGYRPSGTVYTSRVDNTVLHYGYSVGFGVFDYRIINTGVRAAEGFLAESVNFSPAFRLGVIGEWNITNHVSLRSIPGLYFGRRTITFNRSNMINENRERGFFDDGRYPRTKESEVKSIYADIPVLFKYRGVRINNYNYYFVIGASYHLDLKPHNELEPNKNIFVRTKKSDIAIDFGGGADFYFKYFKVGMELRISIGLLDVLDHRIVEEMPEYGVYTKTIGAMRSTLVTLSFNFE